MFSYPIRENIILMQEYDEKALEKIINQCELKDVIEKLPLKLETPIFKFLDDAADDFPAERRRKLRLRALFIKVQRRPF